MPSFTYGTSEITKKEYGIFVRVKVDQATSIKTVFNSETLVLPPDVRSLVEKGMFLDLPINATAIDAVGDLDTAYANQVTKLDNSGGALAFTTTHFANCLGDDEAVVLYCKEYTSGNTITVTDSDSNVFTVTGDNQGVVVFQYDDSGVGTNIKYYIADATFTPLGVCESNPTLTSEKGEEFTTSYGNNVVIDENWNGEANMVQVTKDNWDYLEGIKQVDIDYALYEHSSVGAHSGGYLVPVSGATRGEGHILYKARLNPSLQIQGNAYNGVNFSPSKNTGIASNVYSNVDDYFPSS